jgi:hypothetical protein
MYACTAAAELLRVDAYATAPAATPIGTLGLTMTDIAVHPATGQMYGCTFDSLWAVDKNTAATTLIGSLGTVNGLNALDFSPSGVLHGYDGLGSGVLVTIDLLSGQATVLGAVGSPSGGDLAFDGDTTAYAVDSSNGLFEIDLPAAGVVFVGQLATPATVFGLEVDCDGILYGATSQSELYTIDTVTGAVAPIGAIAGSASALWGLAFERGPAGASVYCTAATTTHGCTPSIGGTGIASASASSGFLIQVAGIEGQRQGLVFYGANGTLALPWGAGSTSFLCVRPPIQRTPVQISGGTHNGCDGALSLDWNAYMAANPAALGHPRFAGQVVDAQAWFRDPPAPKTTNLSDALQFVLAP